MSYYCESLTLECSLQPALICVPIANRLVFFNPLSHHDVSKHNFATSKNDLIFYNICVLERKCSWNCLIITASFFLLPPSSRHFHPLQDENCDSNSRLLVDEDDNGKFSLQRVEWKINLSQKRLFYSFLFELILPLLLDNVYFLSHYTLIAYMLL